MECSITQMSNNRQSVAAENSRSGVEKAPTIQINEEGCPSMDILFIYPAESEGFEPPIRVIRIPHFECGSFDHSDNSPLE